MSRQRISAPNVQHFGNQHHEERTETKSWDNSSASLQYQDSLGDIRSSSASQNSKYEQRIASLLNRLPVSIRLLTREPSGRHTELEARALTWTLVIPILCATAMVQQAFFRYLLGFLAPIGTILTIFHFVIATLILFLPSYVHPFLRSFNHIKHEYVFGKIRWSPISPFTLLTLLVGGVSCFLLGILIPGCGLMPWLFMCTCVATLSWSLPDLSARFLAPTSTTEDAHSGGVSLPGGSASASAVHDANGYTFRHFPISAGMAAGSLCAMLYGSGRGCLYFVLALACARGAVLLLSHPRSPLSTGVPMNPATRIGASVIGFISCFICAALFEYAIDGISLFSLFWAVFVFGGQFIAALAILTLPAPKHTLLWPLVTQIMFVVGTFVHLLMGVY